MLNLYESHILTFSDLRVKLLNLVLKANIAEKDPSQKNLYIPMEQIHQRKHLGNHHTRFSIPSTNYANIVLQFSSLVSSWVQITCF